MPDYAGSATACAAPAERAGHIYGWKCVETYAAIKESFSELAPMSSRRKPIPIDNSSRRSHTKFAPCPATSGVRRSGVGMG